jgi:hypothetical protein
MSEKKRRLDPTISPGLFVTFSQSFRYEGTIHAPPTSQAKARRVSPQWTKLWDSDEFLLKALVETLTVQGTPVKLAT